MSARYVLNVRSSMNKDRCFMFCKPCMHFALMQDVATAPFLALRLTIMLGMSALVQRFIGSSQASLVTFQWVSKRMLRV